MINELNSTLLEGKLTDDPVFREDPNGKWRLAKFDIVNNRRYQIDGKWTQESLFMPVQVWGELASRCIEWLKKGMICRVVGRLRMKKYIGSDGQEKTSFELMAEHLEFRSPYPKKPEGEKGMVVLEKNKDEEDCIDSLAETVVLYEF